MFSCREKNKKSDNKNMDKHKQSTADNITQTTHTYIQFVNVVLLLHIQVLNAIAARRHTDTHI